jgi:hypothetical protein
MSAPLDVRKVAEILGGLTLLDYFPSDPAARGALIELVCSMAQNEDQVQWLVRRMTSGLYNQWPGPREVRACFCSKFKPKDGIEVDSTVYPDGIPSERPRPQLALPPLPVGRLASGDQDIERTVLNLAELKRIEPNGARPQRVPEIPAPPQKLLTQADIDKAVEELHENKRREREGLSDV